MSAADIPIDPNIVKMVDKIEILKDQAYKLYANPFHHEMSVVGKNGKVSTMHIIKGYLIQERVDVIVNTANSELLHSSGLSKLMVDKAGLKVVR